MIALVRLVVVGFVLLSILYGLIWLYSRSVRREKLEKAWDADHPEGGDAAAREAYIRDGMEAYHSSLRPKLILLVYVIPAILMIVTLVVTNWN